MNEIHHNKLEIKGSGYLQLIIYILFGLGPLTGNVILVLFEALSHDFGVSQAAVALAISAFMFPFAIVQLFSGAISDAIGRFKVILLGLVIFCVGMIIAATSLNLIMFLIANVTAGIGFGLVNPVLIALMTDITIPPKIPKKMGFMGAVASLGVAFGPILAGLIVNLGWRYIYVIFAVIIVVCFVIIILLRQPTRLTKGEGLKTLMGHFSQEIRRLPVILMILSAFFVSMSYLATTIWTSRAFAGNIEESIAGIVIGLAGLMSVISSIIGGGLIQKKGVKIPIIIGSIFLFSGILLLLLNPDVTNVANLPLVIIGLILAGFGGGSLFPIVLFYSQILSKERRGALAGLATAGQFIGIALVPILYQPLFMVGGINAIYLAILISALILIVVLILLYYKTK